MKILRLQGENFKRMTAFDITPEGNTVVIAGKNAQGKTSVLDSIAMLFEGKKGNVAKATPKPIKEGAESAMLMAETEKFIVKKKWTDNDHEYLEITSKDGTAHFASPQAMLDAITGDLSFDPLEFTRLKPKEQRELLLGIVTLTIDLEKWQQEHDNLMEHRKVIGREADALKGKLATMKAVPAGTPDEEISMTQATMDYQEAMKHNDQIAKADAEVDAHVRKITEMESMLKILREELARKQTERAGMGEPKDVEAVRKVMVDAEQINTAVRLKKERMAAERDSAAKTEEYEGATKQLEGMRAAKESALASAAFPVPGLGIDDTGVTYNKVPFSQCSSAEQLKVSMAIAMAKNPELRVIRITDGSLLDAENMKVLEEMAARNDFQIWVEKVDDSGKVGIVIEDGKIKK